VAGGHLAAEHLVEQGHRRIAFLGPPTVRQIGDRLAGLRAGVADGSVQVVETDRLAVAAGRPAGERIARLEAGSRPTGVFCANDLITGRSSSSPSWSCGRPAPGRRGPRVAPGGPAVQRMAGPGAARA
jgi:hypothetical protein